MAFILSGELWPTEVQREVSPRVVAKWAKSLALNGRLALAGGMDLARALDTVAETLSEVNVRLQAAPNTYVMPRVLFMFGPLLLLMLYPVALRVVALTTGGA